MKTEEQKCSQKEKWAKKIRTKLFCILFLKHRLVLIITLFSGRDDHQFFSSIAVGLNPVYVHVCARAPVCVSLPFVD